MRIAALLSASLALLCSACGELSYKRGAGEDAFRDAQRMCRSASRPYRDCMAQQGWKVVDIGALNPGLSVAPVADNRAAPLTAAEQKAEQQAELKDIAPDAMVTVASWWKFGAGPDSAVAALADCADRLHLPRAALSLAGGAGYLVTGAQLRCMSEAGWHGLLSRK
jgi:hypothetical protein